ncbi:MAG: stage IV sporulation protein A [Lachnospiraceae bacterium]|nr:stage IV sporulation protein A [Lachnospiraceae bacterium]
MEKHNIYQDISVRTGGEIYLGVVGPVRSGKSTFIKRFMELMVLPEIADENERQRTFDELPQSGTGKTIMTTEPKFIPKEAVELPMEDMKIKIRLIDCVGFMVKGAGGHLENGQERLVKTPWFDYEVPFTKAAEYGTRKVIRDHSTIGILVTTDGSFGEIPRDSYVDAEKKTVEELLSIGKPFIVLLNSDRPYSKATQNLAENLTKEYRTTVMPVNCDQLRQEDIQEILKNVLLEFPLSSVGFYLPKWVETLRDDHWMKKSILDLVKTFMADREKMKDLYQKKIPENEYIESGKIDRIHMDTGEVDVKIQIRDSYYYDILSDLTGIPIKSEYHLIRTMKELAGRKKEFEEVSQALKDARERGYGVMKPVLSEIELSEPEVVKHGNKYGVKIRAEAPSIHLIRANLSTEVAPIVGTQLQAEDLITYIKEQAGEDPKEIWNVNIFGKTLEQLVDDGISGKVTKINEDSQEKLQNAMEKIVNESSGGLICIII